jgi:hypothetical protein
LSKPKQGAIIIRLMLSLIVFFAMYVAKIIWEPVSFMGSAAAAGMQLQNSNVATVQSYTEMSFFSHVTNIIGFIGVIVLAIVWIPFIIRYLKTVSVTGAVILLLGMHPAQAYWSTSNTSEPLGIPANSTAFSIPDLGNTQAGQQQTDDASFYNSHTVPGKIYIVPHQIFDEPGVFSQDYYVSSSRLILVDRTPVSREWTATVGTGTSTLDQSFNCQSIEGLNVKQIGVNISAFIQPQDAATYLYYYGTVPVVPNPNDAYMQANAASDPQGVNDPAVIFASELHATPLDQIMDSKIHSYVGIQICNEIGAHTLNEDNANYVSMMADIQKNVAAYLQTRGITLDYIGWDGAWTFDSDVQAAENNVYVAEETGSELPTLMKSAEVTAIQKWNGQLPSSMTLVGALSDILGGLFSEMAPAHK